MTKPVLKFASLEVLLERMAKRIKAARAAGTTANFNAEILDRVDERFPEILKEALHPLDYQCKVATAIEEIEPEVTAYLEEMDEGSFEKACRRGGRKFPRKTPPEGVDPDR